MSKAIKSFFEVKGPNEIGEKFFLLGLFFLPTALPITGIFFILSLFISFKFNKIEILKSKKDLILIISFILILISTIQNTLINIPKELIDYRKLSLWISLFNWLPLYFFYWGLEPFLKTTKQRILSIKFLISGSIPVLISCIMQELSFYGPYKTFYGLIIWFNKPINEVGGITGLFSNPNYTGIFLTLILPLLFFLIFIEEKSNLISKVILINILLFTIFFSIATNSRNALIGLIIALLTFVNLNKFSTFLFLSFGSFYIFINYFSNIFYWIKIQYFSNFASFCFGTDYLNLICKLINFEDRLGNPRVRVWLSAFSIIKERPLWGWGSSTFSHVFPSKNISFIPYRNLDMQHSHNIVIEIAYNFGIPVAIILTLSIIFLLKDAFKVIIIKQNKRTIPNYLNKAWIISLLVVLFSQLFDITYYDGKISLLFVILLCGTKCLIKENKKFKFRLN